MCIQGLDLHQPRAHHQGERGQRLLDAEQVAARVNRERLLQWRYRYWPDQVLAKRWTETAIPAILLVLVLVALSQAIPDFLSRGSLSSMSRQAGEIGLM